VVLLGALAALGGANQAFIYPAYQSLFPQTVGRENLQSANSIRSILGSTASILGPSLAALLATVVSLPAAWLFCCVCYVISAVLVTRLRVDAVGDSEESVVAQMRSSWRYFREQKWLVAIDAYGAVWHLIVWAPFMVIGASLVGTAYGNPAQWGYLQAVLGLGSLLGGVISARVRAKRTAVVAVVGVSSFGIVNLVLGLHGSFPIVLLCVAAGGIGLELGDVFWSTTMQTRVPANVLGQAYSYDYLVSVALLPLGFAAAPSIASAFGGRVLLVIGAAVCVVGACLLIAMRQVRVEPVEQDRESVTTEDEAVSGTT
jgi:hypothetical protein